MIVKLVTEAELGEGQEMTNDQYRKKLRKVERILIVMVLIGIIVMVMWNLINFIRVYDEFNTPYASYPLFAGFVIGLFTIFLVSFYRRIDKDDIEQ